MKTTTAIALLLAALVNAASAAEPAAAEINKICPISGKPEIGRAHV